jgi:hypothetical protein
MLQAPESFLRDVLWPAFEALNEALVGYLAQVTARIIRDEIHGETGEAEERSPTLPPPRSSCSSSSPTPPSG